MKKITFLLALLICASAFGQRVEPTFVWSNKSAYQINGESAVTFKPGDIINIEITYTLGSTGGTPDAFNFILAGLQDEAQADVDVLTGTWANMTVAQPNDYKYPPAGTGGVTTVMNYPIPADAELNSANANLTYRILAYLAYTPDGGSTTYGGVGASDPTLVYIRSQEEIDALLSNKEFKKLTSFYPNPAENELHFGSDVITDSYKILSVTGALIRDVKATSRTLDVSYLKTGLYFIATDSGVAKFLKK
jgi:hypothetical protein